MAKVSQNRHFRGHGHKVAADVREAFVKWTEPDRDRLEDRRQDHRGVIAAVRPLGVRHVLTLCAGASATIFENKVNRPKSRALG